MWDQTVIVDQANHKLKGVTIRHFETLGVMTDLMVYSVIIPVVPFQLEHLGYSSVSVLTAWLLFAYVSRFLVRKTSC